MIAIPSTDFESHHIEGYARMAQNDPDVMKGFGMSARAAIDLLREKRCDRVLCNQAFERYLLEIDEADRAA